MSNPMTTATHNTGVAMSIPFAQIINKGH